MAKEKQELQEKYMEFQMMEQNKRQIVAQLQTLDEQLGELELVITNLEDIKGVEKGTELVIPLANGIFARAKMENAQDLIVNIGGHVAVEKKADEVKEMLRNQTKEIQDIRQRLEMEFRRLDISSAQLAEKIQSMTKKE